MSSIILNPALANLSPFFVRTARLPQPQFRLFCFPYAGGNSNIYRTWPARLHPNIEVIAMELPGRGSRIREKPYACLDSLVNCIVEEIAPLMDVPAIFFGHSNGALICYALAHKLQEMNLPLPQYVFISAKTPPHLEKKTQRHCLTDEALIEELRTLNGTPPEILSNPEMMEFVLPLLRADFSLSETFNYENYFSVNCNAIAIGGTHDTEVSYFELLQWQKYFQKLHQPVMIQGDHFFIDTKPDEIIELIIKTLYPAQA